MSLPDLTSPKGIAVVAGVVLAIGGVGWAVSARSGSSRPASTLPQELQIESLKAQTADPGKMRDTVRDAFEREDLTPEQRQELRRNMREVWTAAMNERVDAYFNAPEDKKLAVLDAQIDQFMAQMKQWQEDRKDREDRTRDRPREGEGPPGGFRSPSQEERKNRSESRNPDQMARTMAYFSAVQQRMTQRGIQMPGGGRGGFMGGGPGGGRGSGRRGP